MRTKLNTIALSMLLATSAAEADVGDLFQQMGGSWQQTNPGVFKGQTMNHYVGGSASWRIPQKTYQLMAFSPPRVSAGCGGIDLYAGSFSFINSDQLVQMMQNIGNNAVGAIFKLALDAVSPQIGGVIDYFNDLAQKINSLNVNSCQMAEGIVNAIPGIGDERATENMFSLYGTSKGIYDDVSQAGEKIKQNISARQQAKNSLKSSQDELFYNKIKDINITWEMLRNAKYNGNQKLSLLDAQIITTLFGSVICEGLPSDKPGEEVDRVCIFHKPSKDAMKSFLDGTAYIMAKNCSLNSGECLFDDYAINKNYSYSVDGKSYSNFTEYVHEQMQWLRERIEARQLSFTDFDEGGTSGSQAYRAFHLINMSSVPAWAIIKLASHDNGGASYFKGASETIAADIAYNYVLNLSKAIDISVNSEMLNNKYIFTENDRRQLERQQEEIEKTIAFFHDYHKDSKLDMSSIIQTGLGISQMADAFNYKVGALGPGKTAALNK